VKLKKYRGQLKKANHKKYKTKTKEKKRIKKEENIIKNQTKGEFIGG
jgi:hypothetical protein